MSKTNPYFNHYFAKNEQNLIQNLIDETIYCQGIECAYIPKNQDNIDKLFNEDPTAYYDTYKKLAMYPLFVDGFDGSELMTMFGNDFQKSATFVISKKQFKLELEALGTNFPREGDLIFMPITNAVLEIKYVDNESPFFEKGKQYVYQVKCEVFTYSYEDMKSGDLSSEDDLLDSIYKKIEIDVADGEQESYSKNDDIQELAEHNVEFNPDNPFGVL